MTAPEHATAVEVRDFSLRAGHRQLLAATSARFEPGQITLIVGPSGAGKSLLLRVLAGLIGPGQGEIGVSGELYVDDRQVLGKADGFQDIGVVFQNFALFDELSPLDNVRFAADHRLQKNSAASEQLDPQRLLNELGVPLDVRTASLSGGQRQRLAIARTLAYDPSVILYDEPTSGLDAGTAAQVAALIQTTHLAHGKTSIIVTHDDRALAPIADRVYLLDSTSQTLRPIDRAEWSQLGERMHSAAQQAPVDKPKEQPTPAQRSFGKLLGDFGTYLANFLVGSSRSLELAARFPARLVPRWRSPRWGLRYLIHYLRLVADPSAWLYIAVAGAITGYVATYFTFRFLPFRSYTEPLVIENLLEALGFTIYRVFVPVLATMMVAARCGAAVSSDVGGKVYGQQTDAMRTFGADPLRYLATNIYWSFLLGTLVLVGIGFCAAQVASLVVFTLTHPDRGPFFWDNHFFYQLKTPGEWLYRGTGWLVAKLLVSAAGIGAITYDRGSRPKYSSEDVSVGITSTVLWTTLYVLVVHMAFALVEFEPR